MAKRVSTVMLVVAALLAISIGGAPARSSWPPRSTPLRSTLGWFRAINAHDRRHLLFYVAPSARDQMGWAQPSLAWSKFTRLRCRTLKASTRDHAIVLCTFHESASPTEGNPDTFWDVYLRHTVNGWLIDNYGQG